MKMGHVFYSEGGAAAPSIATGWYYQIDMAEPVGPFEDQIAAGKAARATIIGEDVDTSEIPEAGEEWFAKAKLTRGFDVHLVKPMRVKHAGVRAASMEEAILLAMKLPDTEAESIEDTEEGGIEALVDVVGDVEFSESTGFNIEHNRDGDPMLSKEPDGSFLERMRRAYTLVNTLARMTKEGEIVDGKEYEPSNDDDIDALYSAISAARRIVGIMED